MIYLLPKSLNRAFSFLIGVLLSLGGIDSLSAAPALQSKNIKLRSNHPVKSNIVTTYFWIGQGTTGYNSTTNYASAWDMRWTKSFGGVDQPYKRGATTTGLVTLPSKFAPTRNPYYVALPFNDIKYPKLAAKHVPWWNAAAHKKSPYQSQCKGRWIMIEFNGKACFAQWEDVGPLRYDHVGYVFGKERPTSQHSRAGLDVSPAVRDYLGLTGLNKTSWRFVEDDEVPYGPWIEYGEQAIIFSAIKAEKPQSLN
jgi:hypothetical protein